MRTTTTLFLAALFAALFAAPIVAQTEKTPALDWGGFARVDYFFDSRQTYAAREGHMLLVPKPEALDADGEDVNAAPNANMLAIATRLNVKATGPDVLGAETFAFVEGAFFGAIASDVNEFRLRHAFLRMDWGSTRLLLGQTWHPFMLTENYAGTVSFNTGAPFQAFSRNPQLRLYQDLAPSLWAEAAAVSQRDFASPGPNGNSSSYLRDAVVPEFALHVKYLDGGLFAAVGAEYKTLRPALSAENPSGDAYVTEATVSSAAFQAALGYTGENFHAKSMGVMGENLADLLSLGGYAVSRYDGPIDGAPVVEYTTLGTMQGWLDLQYGGALSFGALVGYAQNTGAQESVVGQVYAQLPDYPFVDAMWRLSPRVKYRSGPALFGLELEYTSVDYGTPTDAKYTIGDATTVANARVIFVATYFF